MQTPETQQAEAERLTAEAQAIRALGGIRESVRLLEMALLRYAEAERLAQNEGREPNMLWRQARAQACTLCAEWLEASDYPAEAARTYQEAADVWGSLESMAEALENIKLCAHRAVLCTRAVEGHPLGRLSLLIVHYEHQQQQLALREGTEAEQAHICARIGTILFRRGYAIEAISRYHRAIRLYMQAPPLPVNLFAQGECYHQLGRIYAGVLENLEEAQSYYGEALDLYVRSGLSGEREHLLFLQCKEALKDVTERSKWHKGGNYERG